MVRRSFSDSDCVPIAISTILYPFPVRMIRNIEHRVYMLLFFLQKYRTARYKPEPSAEGPSEKKPTPTQDLSSLDLKTSSEMTKALRLLCLQVEVQKRLHEQLEIYFFITWDSFLGLFFYYSFPFFMLIISKLN
ncbi:protein PHR1-LIKE 1-like isoform X2 [Helianthus annuus]|uniref:protein PHR1-LIKE 1-like isoform X2 n=1 Tax=Helianthus annuus TaxID=4232 RepID=UPI000B8F966B|nr:protein PHR1-LIKE 1-like isoform X2 [Helianthus annuus]